MPVSESLIIQVAQEILETLAFLSTRPMEEVAAPGAEPVRMCVEYEGPFTGIMSLEMPKSMLMELAANMLGVDPGEVGGEQQQYDALGELANVLCGNLLGQIGGPEQIFNLKAPQIMTSEAWTPWLAKGQVQDAKIGLDDGWAEVTLVISSAAA